MGFFEFYGIGIVVSFIFFVFMNRVWFGKKSPLGPPPLIVIFMMTFLSWIGVSLIAIIFLIDLLDHTNIVDNNGLIIKMIRFITGED